MQGHYEKRIDIAPQQLDIPHNHRRIFIGETIFDIDTHIRVISDKIHDFISSNLIKDNISHQVWDTSRSPHIHCFFKGLNLYSQEIRIQLKKLILRHYAGKYINFIDLSKVSENNMIRDFNGIHEVTGKPKTLIYEFEGAEPTHNGLKTQSLPMENSIKPEILEQLRVLHLSYEKMPETAHIAPTDSDKQAMQEFVSYCCENTHRHDGKERILFKNIAIACLLLNYDTNARHRIYYNVVRNCSSRRHISELISWDKWAQKQKDLRFSWKQVNPFYEMTYSQNILKKP